MIIVGRSYDLVSAAILNNFRRFIASKKLGVSESQNGETRDGAFVFSVAGLLPLVG